MRNIANNNEFPLPNRSTHRLFELNTVLNYIAVLTFRYLYSHICTTGRWLDHETSPGLYKSGEQLRHTEMPSPSTRLKVGGKSKFIKDSEILRTVSVYCEYLATTKKARERRWSAAAKLHKRQIVKHPSIGFVDFNTLMSVLADLGAIKFDSTNRTPILYNLNKLKSLASIPVHIVVETSEQCKRGVENLRESETIAIDAQWCDEELCCLQVISVEARNHIYLFDTYKLKRDELVPLRDLLEDSKVLKIGHDLRRCASLLSQSHIEAKLNHVLDTVIMYRAVANKPEYNSDLSELYTKYGIKMYMDKDRLYASFNRNRVIWKQRPLNEDVIRYAGIRVQNLGLLKDRLQDDLVLKLYDRSANHINEYKLLKKIDPHNPHAQLLNVDLWLEFDEEGKPTYEPILDKIENIEEGISKSEIKSEDEESAELSMKNGSIEKKQVIIDEDLGMLLDMLPDFARNAIVNALEVDDRLKNKQIADVKVDADRPITLGLGSHDVILDESTRREEVGEYTDILKNIHFSDDNRGGISGTLHRVSVMRSRAKARPDAPLSNVVGLTYRIGRPRYGNPAPILDLLHRIRSSQTSLIILGAPGCGKSTLLRSCIRYVAHDLGQSTVVVDTSNELGGDGIAPHPVIQPARRLMVPERRHQYLQLLEAVQNHSPKVVVVDEIATKREVEALRSITHRGVACLATCHGKALDSLLSNPDLVGLAGGTSKVTLNGVEAKLAAKNRADKSNGVKKSQTERAGLPPFGTAVELVDYNTFVVHHDVARSVDNMLAKRSNRIETRRIVNGDNRLIARFSMI